MLIVRRSVLAFAMMGGACVSTSTVENSAPPAANANTSVIVPGAAAPSRPPRPYNPNEVLEANDWIQTDGRFIYYRYASYLPDACRPNARRQTFATGNFNGWTISPVICLPGGEWLAFDALATLRAGSTRLNTTYCINFRDGAGAWGAHGRPPLAPGIENFVVPTPRRMVGGELRDWGQEGINPGFRIVRGDGGAFTVTFASYHDRSERITITWLGPQGVTLEPQAPGDPRC
jgi:hypothetical protein